MGNAYVTGADRGLGLAMTKVLLKNGYHVYAGRFMPDWPQLDELQKEYGEQLTIVPLDITSDGSVKKAAEMIKETTDSLDILVNNAGISRDHSGTILEELYFDDIRRIMETNAYGPLRVTNSVIHLLLKGQKKMIVNISSEAGSISNSYRTKQYGYCMSKAALNMQCTILQNHLKEFGVKVLAIHPGWLRSYMSGKLSERGTVEPDDSAEGIYRLIQTQTDPEGPMYMDYQGNLMQW